MKIRNTIAFLLFGLALAAITGCGNANAKPTAIKDTTPQPAAAPVSGADST